MKSKVRELETRLLRSSDDEERLRILVDLARAHSAEFRNREGLRAAREALAIARRRRDVPAIGEALSIATHCHYQRGDYASAVATGLDAVEAYAEGDRVGRSRALQSIALALFAVEAYDLALSMALRAVEDARAANDGDCEAYACTVSGAILGDRGQFNEARRHFRVAAAHYRQRQDAVRVKKSASNLGHTYRKQGIWHEVRGNLPQARIYWKRALGVYRVALAAGAQEGDDAIILGSMAECQCSLGDIDAAHETVRKALVLATLGKNATVLAHCHLWEAHILRARGDLAGAERALGDARVFASAVEHDEVLATCLHALAAVVLARGDGDKAAEIEGQAVRVAREREEFLAHVREDLSPIWERYTDERPAAANARSAA
jgi:tetratricopeptide (TPR) repeat protein